MSNPRYLIDQNMPPGYITALRQRMPQIDVVAVGEPNAPPLDTGDQAILDYVVATQRVLVTHNRRSMVEHELPKFLSRGEQHWGVFRVQLDMPFRHFAEELVLIWENSTAEEWRDLLISLPYFT